jgi:hypothetical protein
MATIAWHIGTRLLMVKEKHRQFGRTTFIDVASKIFCANWFSPLDLPRALPKSNRLCGFEMISVRPAEPKDVFNQLFVQLSSFNPVRGPNSTNIPKGLANPWSNSRIVSWLRSKANLDAGLLMRMSCRPGAVSQTVSSASASCLPSRDSYQTLRLRVP